MTSSMSMHVVYVQVVPGTYNMNLHPNAYIPSSKSCFTLTVYVATDAHILYIFGCVVYSRVFSPSTFHINQVSTFTDIHIYIYTHGV